MEYNQRTFDGAKFQLGQDVYLITYARFIDGRFLTPSVDTKHLAVVPGTVIGVEYRLQYAIPTWAYTMGPTEPVRCVATVKFNPYDAARDEAQPTGFVCLKGGVKKGLIEQYAAKEGRSLEGRVPKRLIYANPEVAEIQRHGLEQLLPPEKAIKGQKCTKEAADWYYAIDFLTNL